DAHFRVEVHERHVVGFGQHVEELDRRRTRELQVFTHAAARVEEEPDMKLLARSVVFRFFRADAANGVVAAHEQAKRLLLAVFDDVEVVAGEGGNDIALLVGDRDTEVHELDAGAKGWLLPGKRGGASESQQEHRALHGRISYKNLRIDEFPNSEHAKTGDAHRLGALAAVLSTPAKTVTPLDRPQG